MVHSIYINKLSKNSRYIRSPFIVKQFTSRLGGFKMKTAALDISWIGALSGLAMVIILILFIKWGVK
jgi:hypothetical protein